MKKGKAKIKSLEAQQKYTNQLLISKAIIFIYT